MSNQPKPLSETHPTLWDKIPEDDFYATNSVLEAIQSCTADIREYERVVRQRDDWVAQSDSWLNEARHYKTEVERLKKELEDLKEVGIYKKQMFESGVVEGERRVMQRVKDLLLEARNGALISRKNDVEHNDFYKGALSYIGEIWEELGLGDEEETQ